MSQLHFATATELASKIKRREISAAELLDHFLGRVEKYNPRLNAIIWMDVDGASEVGDPGVGGGRTRVGRETPACVVESGGSTTEGRNGEGESDGNVVFRRRVLP